MKKAARIHPGFGDAGGTLEATLASIFVDALLKGKEESYSMNELRSMTAASNDYEIRDALQNLEVHGIIHFRDPVEDMANLGSIEPLSLCMTVCEVQGLLPMHGKPAPRPTKDRALGEDSAFIGGVEYAGKLAPLPPEPGPYVLTITRIVDAGDGGATNECEVFAKEYGGETGGAEAVLEAWAEFDAYVDTLKQCDSIEYWLTVIDPQAKGKVVVDEDTFNALDGLEKTIDSTGCTFKTVGDRKIWLGDSEFGDEHRRWPGLIVEGAREQILGGMLGEQAKPKRKGNKAKEAVSTLT